MMISRKEVVKSSERLRRRNTYFRILVFTSNEKLRTGKRRENGEDNPINLVTIRSVTIREIDH